MHRGARHGLKQNGKLRRIQEQESLHIQASKPTSSEANVSNHLSTVNMDICEPLPNKKRKKKKKKQPVARPEQFTVDVDEEKRKKSKKTSKEIMDHVCLLQDERTKDNRKCFTEDDKSTKGIVVGVLNGEEKELADKPVKKKRKKSKAKI